MRQHSKPTYITPESSKGLKRLEYSDRKYDENWLQNIIQEHPGSIPINEIEPVFANSVALCTELQTKSGFCDNVFINDEGYITLIESKLWRNPEARRTVLAQILDYAKDIAQWQYSKFENKILKARKEHDKSLIDVMREYNPDINETEFVDSVNKNLKKARFLLLIIGDGIRENAEELLDFLNLYGDMRFVLSFVEMPTYHVRNHNEFIITPRVLAKTTELKRVTEDKHKTVEKQTSKSSQSTSESVFYERLTKNIGNKKAKELKLFIDDLQEEFEIKPKMGRGKSLSLNLKADETYNLGSIQQDGRLFFYGIVNKTEEIGDEQIGIEYLKNLAEIIDAQFYDDYKKWMWCVKQDGKYPDIRKFIDRKEDWKKEIEEFMNKIKKIESG